MKIIKQVTSALFISLICCGYAAASDAEELTAMLHDFLASADKLPAHQMFWADDLVYTSSDGSRFGKSEILAGFEGAEPADEPPGTFYSGIEVDVRVHDDMAVVAFKLVGTPTDKSAETDVLYFYNTGTFLKRDGVWQVIAWQATKIPPQ